MSFTQATKNALALIKTLCISSIFFTTSYAVADETTPPLFVGSSPSPSEIGKNKPASRLVDGESTFVPWTVWVVNTDEKWCSGIAYNQWWVMTSQYCGKAKTIYFPKQGSADYDAVPVQDYILPDGKVQLIRLVQPKPLSSYPEFDPNYHILSNDKTTIFGYGNDRSLSQLNGTVIFDNVGDNIIFKLINGKVAVGDLGAPLLINGKVVAIHDGGTVETSMATPLSYVKGFLEENGVTGIYDLTFNTNKQIEFKVSNKLFNSDNKVVVWVDGEYRASMKNGQTRYIPIIEDDGDNKIIKLPELPGPYSDLTYVQIGVVPGELDYDSPGKPEDSSLIVQKMINGIQSVTRDQSSQAVRIKLNTALFNSSDYTVIRINGEYAGETHQGSLYYGQLISKGPESTTIQFIPEQPNSVADWVKIERRYVDKNGVTQSAPLYEGVISTLIRQ